MPKGQSPPFLQDERKKTDDSLIAERDKTNESLQKSRETTERQLDAKVTTEREGADKTTLKSRKSADTARDKNRASAGYNPEDEVAESDKRLVEERRKADEAIDFERKRVDVAIDNERELKSALASRLLERERKITDANLKDERFQTDSNVDLHTHQLSEEKREHLRTQTSLTSRDEFIAIVSHDLRNPIGSVFSCADMLLTDDSFKHIDEEVRHWMTFIKRNADTSLRLISDLLDVEKISHGKVLVDPADNSLVDVVREAVETFTLAASTKSVLLRALPSDVTSPISFDHDRILQVLCNLIGNALKFTPGGGSITVSIHLSDGEVLVTVADSGPGIAEDQIEQIFERFAQLKSQDRSGLGLGLYISKMLIEAHNGKLWVKSKVNIGSEFIFSLPVRNRQSGTAGI